MVLLSGTLIGLWFESPSSSWSHPHPFARHKRKFLPILPESILLSVAPSSVPTRAGRAEGSAWEAEVVNWGKRGLTRQALKPWATSAAGQLQRCSKPISLTVARHVRGEQHTTSQGMLYPVQRLRALCPSLTLTPYALVSLQCFYTCSGFICQIIAFWLFWNSLYEAPLLWRTFSQGG